jgi:hypothetical protein
MSILTSERLTPSTYYTLVSEKVDLACSFSVEYADLEGTVQWYFKDEVIKNEAFTKKKFKDTEIYNISCTNNCIT